MSFDLPIRPRRIRQNASIRKFVEETSYGVHNLVAPVFVVDGENRNEPIASMPGISRFSLDLLLSEIKELTQLGIPAIALFPSIDSSLKSEDGSHGLDPSNITYRAIRAIKQEFPTLLVIADVALDPYTSHGHDGLIAPDGQSIENDATVAMLSRMAVLLAIAGADIVAPSDMMDGRVGEIRNALDNAGFINTLILAYSAKFASSLYGPFRDAVGSASAAGTHHLDKKSYQLNPANAREAIHDALLDELEAADILMVKPAGWYLDIIQTLRHESRLPIAAYQISGEYALITAAAQNGWIDRQKAIHESILAIRRAGATMILTYFAKEIAANFHAPPLPPLRA